MAGLAFQIPGGRYRRAGFFVCIPPKSSGILLLKKDVFMRKKSPAGVVPEKLRHLKFLINFEKKIR